VAVNRVSRFGAYRAELIDGVAYNVHHTTERCGAYRDRDRAAEVFYLHPANHAIRWKHRNGTHAAFAKVLLHFCHNIDLVLYVETL
jgi:hypothetical protein